jgi:hypothetical protein
VRKPCFFDLYVEHAVHLQRPVVPRPPPCRSAASATGGRQAPAWKRACATSGIPCAREARTGRQVHEASLMEVRGRAEGSGYPSAAECKGTYHRQSASGMTGFGRTVASSASGHRVARPEVTCIIRRSELTPSLPTYRRDAGCRRCLDFRISAEVGGDPIPAAWRCYPFRRASIHSHLQCGLLAAGSGPVRSTRPEIPGAAEQWPRQPTARYCLFSGGRAPEEPGARMRSASADYGPASDPAYASRRQLPGVFTPARSFGLAPDPASGGQSRQSGSPDILAAYLAADSGPRISLIHAVRRASAWAGVSPGNGGGGVSRSSDLCSVMPSTPRRAAFHDCR